MPDDKQDKDDSQPQPALAQPDEADCYYSDDQTMDVDSIVRSMFRQQHDEPQQSAYLIVLAGGQVGELCRVGDDLVVGRSSDTGFRLVDNGVSKAHLRLTRGAEGEILLEDLASRNGTYVNGERVSHARLSDGDKIHLGSTTILKFSIADSLEASFQRKMYDAAVNDPLTGLYNRRRLVEVLDSELAYALRHHSPLSLIMLDIDHFKRLNDTYGHPVGDAVLRGLAIRILRCVRREDLSARYGGEEFAVVCRGVTAEEASVLAERLRRTTEQGPLVAERPEVRVTISVGVADVTPGIDHRDGLISAADEQLYRAKHEGRNRVCVKPPK